MVAATQAAQDKDHRDDTAMMTILKTAVIPGQMRTMINTCNPVAVEADSNMMMRKMITGINIFPAPVVDKTRTKMILKM
jgi:hypothetical protein